MVGGAAILQVVEVVGDQVAVDAGPVQQLGEGVVERLQRPPAAVQEAQPAGLHVAPCRHAGQATDIVPVEGQRARRQPVEVGCRDARAAIGPQQVPVERVEQDEDGLHGQPRQRTPDYAGAWWS